MKNGIDENQTVMEFLESAGAAALESKRLQRRLDGLSERSVRLGTKRGAKVRRLDRLIRKEWERELAAAEKELESYREVETFLERIPDGTQRMILRRKYLDVGLSWTEIQDRLAEDGVFYSQRHIIRLHTQAVEAARVLWIKERGEGTVKKRR